MGFDPNKVFFLSLCTVLTDLHFANFPNVAAFNLLGAFRLFTQKFSVYRITSNI